ncbi:MAG: HAD-IA family hydrolase [Chloroflexota bacterium]|nr:HAD-IA family hydrolase [Chloroflexota bacterium]
MATPLVRGALFDLLMAVMDSLAVWALAAGDRERGLAWRDAVTDRMTALHEYQPYDELVVLEAARLGLPAAAPDELFRRWTSMRPWPDAAALKRLELPFGFLTNCSASLARLAAERSQLEPRFSLSAEEIGCYKPDPRAYRAGCERLGTPPEQALFVAGTPYDARGAAAAGLQARLVVRRPEQAEAVWAVATYASLDDVVDRIRDGVNDVSRW